MKTCHLGYDSYNVKLTTPKLNILQTRVTKYLYNDYTKLMIK